MSFITTRWLIENAISSIYWGIIWVFVCTPWAWIAYKRWLFSKKPDGQVTFLYAYFEKQPFKKKCELIISTQLTALLETMLEPGACRLLYEYYRKALNGTMIRFSTIRDKQAILAHLANYYWAARSSDGQVARSFGCPTIGHNVVLCLISTPNLPGQAAMGRKYRILVVRTDTLDNLPSVHEVEETTPKTHEWVALLHHVATTIKDERDNGSWPYLSFEEGKLVIRS